MLDTRSNIYLKCILSIGKMNELLASKLKGQAIKEKLVLKRIVLRADREWLYVDLTTEGQYDGDIEAQFKLKALPDRPEFGLDRLTITLLGKGFVRKGINWVVNNLLGKQIESRVQAKIQKVMNEIVQELIEHYGTTRLANGMSMQTDIEEFHFDMVRWDAENIYCNIRAVASIEVHL